MAYDFDFPFSLQYILFLKKSYFRMRKLNSLQNENEIR